MSDTLSGRVLPPDVIRFPAIRSDAIMPPLLVLDGDMPVRHSAYIRRLAHEPTLASVL